ncbi:hypothetical protein GCM10023349_38020 [Nocardioides conyzicola]|uniref:Uncharacterized protein n=1 Tax=Nocardioides conyzicola TaxID=1651781 RepID=A0ABP8XXK1_9ACTN
MDAVPLARTAGKSTHREVAPNGRPHLVLDLIAFCLGRQLVAMVEQRDQHSAQGTLVVQVSDPFGPFYDI